MARGSFIPSCLSSVCEQPPEPLHPVRSAAIPEVMVPVLSLPFPSSDVEFQLHVCGAGVHGHAWKWLHPWDLCWWEPQHLPVFCLKSPVVEEPVTVFSPGILDLIGGMESSGIDLLKANMVLRSI